MDGVDYDVIIVGAGTAGCYLAKKLTESGLSVCVLEQNAKTKVDSGIVSSHFFDYVRCKPLIKARIKAMDLVGPNAMRINIRSRSPFAFLLNREKLGKQMRAGTRSHINNERFVGCEVHKGWVGVKTSDTNSSPSVHHNSCSAAGQRSHHSYSCKVLVGADGAMSAVRKEMKITAPEMTWGVVKHGKEARGPISVYFDKTYSPDGFAWRIPQNGEVGLLSSTRPMEYFQRFLDDVIDNKSNGKSSSAIHGNTNSIRHIVGAPIPVGTCRSYADRTILVGDAAGQVKPLTAGGIVWGLRCADIAARAVEYAFEAKRFDEFFWKTEYERKWHAAIGRELKRQSFVRNIYRKLGNDQVGKIFEQIKPQLEILDDFDYDALSEIAKKFPKLSIARVVIPSLLKLS